MDFKLPIMTKVDEPWSVNSVIEDNILDYGIHVWGRPYFGVNEKGHVEVSPLGEGGPKVDLRELVEELLERGMRVPIMIRFPDILNHRMQMLMDCFQKAALEFDFKGRYRGVYPIKVNQQRHLVEEIVEQGRRHGWGLEAGSKSELLVAVAMAEGEDFLIICNGYKDVEYVQMALWAQKLGRYPVLVVDRFEELPLIIQVAESMGVKPHLGFRVKLNASGQGRWQDSVGFRSKFGLTSLEVVEGLQWLEQKGWLSQLELIHFHVGSQVPNIQAFKGAFKEGVRFFTEIYRWGAHQLRFLDIGGGLGVDYDGSGRSDMSVNYSVQEYANDVVSLVQTICDEKGVPHPDIISESGRFLVAPYSVLIFNVTGRGRRWLAQPIRRAQRSDPQVMQDLQYVLDRLSLRHINEAFNDLQQLRQEYFQLFVYGVLSLEQRAWCERVFMEIVQKMLMLIKGVEEFERLQNELMQELRDTYYCNFSVFQSIPDLWAMDQVFPVMPIHRLNEKPQLFAALADLTCDSDGVVDQFADPQSTGLRRFLPVHELIEGQPYYLAIFLTGAYQEILGDLHNLFGDTDAVHVRVAPDGYFLDHYVPGDTVAEVLSYVQYLPHLLLERLRHAAEQAVVRQKVTKAEVKQLLRFYEDGLGGYTYLED